MSICEERFGAELGHYVEDLFASLPSEVRKCAALIDYFDLCRDMSRVGMTALPEPSGNEYISSGDATCPVCSKSNRTHPQDWRIADENYDRRPCLVVLCNGDRVKL